MHELAIANSIVKTVMAEAARRDFKRITAVGLRIGVLSDVVPEALDFGFTAIIADTPLEGARLEIERIPVAGTCRSCSHDFEVKEFVFVCPQCGSKTIDVNRGNELDIAYVEVDDG